MINHVKKTKLANKVENGRVGPQGARDKESNLNYEVREGLTAEGCYVLRPECSRK